MADKVYKLDRIYADRRDREAPNEFVRWLGIKNSGGVRPMMRPRGGPKRSLEDTAALVLVSRHVSGSGYNPWEDVVDRNQGRIWYWGDAKADEHRERDDFGGNKRLLLKLEIEFPILTAVGIKGVVFADAGNAFDNDQPVTLNMDIFSDEKDGYEDVLRTAVGFGFRWFSPIGPLRFEWGIPLAPVVTPTRSEKPLVFDFSIGNAF